MSRFEKVASAISIGEPDPALFVEPMEYQAVIPSEQLTRGRSAGGLPVQETSEQWWLELDKKHAELQKNRR